MRELRIFWLPVLFAAVGGVVAFACDGAPPDTLDAYQPYAVSTSATDPADASLADATIKNTSAPADAASDATDARDSASDANGDDAGPPLSPFLDAGDFEPDAGASTIQPSHNFAGNVPTTNPSKQACLNCHVATGAAPVFVYAGSVFSDDAGTPAAGAEVSLRDTTGNIALTYSDAYGNFFVEVATLTFPATVGVRTAANEVLMVSEAESGNCNACHDGNAQAFIHVP